MVREFKIGGWRFLVAWCAVAALLTACATRDPDEVRIGLFERDGMLQINVMNETKYEVTVPANFLDFSRKHELSLVVVSREGLVRPLCDGIDYVHGSDIRKVPPRQSVQIEVPVSAVKIAYCLEDGGRYEARAVLTVRSNGIDRSFTSAVAGFTPR